MNLFKKALLLALFVVAIGASYTAGYVMAYRKGTQNLATVALWLIKPALIVNQMETEKPGTIPKPLLNNVEGAMFMVATHSEIFQADFVALDEEEKSALCIIAKNREAYRPLTMPSKSFDEHLMQRLDSTYRRLSAERSATGPQGRLDCSVEPFMRMR